MCRIYVYIIIVVSIVLMGACDGVRNIGMVEYNDLIDLTPPVLENTRVLSHHTVEFCFDEMVTVADNSLQADEELGVVDHSVSECGIMVSAAQRMTPGTEYIILLTVMDGNRNSLDIITTVYGYNDAVPDIVINEFTTKGSKSHPDMIELYTLTAGNVGGVTLYEGSMEDWESRIMLPAVDIAAGSYLLIHAKPQGIETEIDETVSPTQSGGLDVHENAWDFWVREGDGLSGNNGALTLTAAPRGEIVDAVIYTNRTSSSDADYRGFGSSRNLSRADELHVAEAWHAKNEQIRPEDAISSDGTTATRSMSRSSDSTDTNRKEDWHMVPTSHYSFGEENSNEVHLR